LDEDDHEKEKTETIVGFEPTGHYWFTLGDYLQSKGYQLGIVNPFHVKCTRELDDNSPTKNDRKDPKTIAVLVKDGRFRDVYIPEDMYQELREAVLERERLQDQIIALSNQVIRWLDIRFPEFSNVFKDWTGKTAQATLRAFPTPARIISAGAEDILKTWQVDLQRASLKKAEKLVRAAAISIGRTAGIEAAEIALENLLMQYEMITEQPMAKIQKTRAVYFPPAQKHTAIRSYALSREYAIINLSEILRDMKIFE